VGVAMAGMVEGLAGAAIAVGALVAADATSRLVAAVGGVQSIGRAMSATSAAGQKLQVYITREGTT
jgi:Uncharacterized conserved protein (DUF2190)